MAQTWTSLGQGRILGSTPASSPGQRLASGLAVPGKGGAARKLNLQGHRHGCSKEHDRGVRHSGGCAGGGRSACYSPARLGCPFKSKPICQHPVSRSKQAFGSRYLSRERTREEGEKGMPLSSIEDVDLLAAAVSDLCLFCVVDTVLR